MKPPTPKVEIHNPKHNPDPGPVIKAAAHIQVHSICNLLRLNKWNFQCEKKLKEEIRNFHFLKFFIFFFILKN